jgi:hypothetical protein
MANKINSKDVKETKTTTEVKGTTNNVGQEITKLQATDVVVCTMTEEEHKARIERINTKMEQGLKLSWDILVDITSAKERHEHVLDGYDDTTEAFNKWAMALFGMGETQIKQASRLISFYGSIDDKGEYSLDDKYKRYTKEKLDIIQRIPKLKTKAQFDEVTETFGIMPSTSESVLKEIVREAKGLPQKTEEEKAKEKEEKAKAKEQEAVKKTAEEVKANPMYKEVEGKRDVLLKYVQDLYTEAKTIKDSKNDKLAMAFITKLIDEFPKMEKAYNEVTNK